MDTRKRGRGEGASNANGGFKKSKQEMDSLTSGIGTKSKPCTKFFSTSGCPFGENCHFLHYVSGGYKAVTHLLNPNTTPALRNMPVVPPQPVSNGVSSPAVKTRLCTKFNTAEGCKFDNKCRFAHGEWELGMPIAPSHEDTRNMGPIQSRFVARTQAPAPAPAPAATFGASANAKISVDASLAGAIIGKGGVTSKQICWQTGVKLAIRDHDSDPNLKNIELEGTFEQIKEASSMVREMIVRISSAAGPTKNPGMHSGGPPRSMSNYKTKLCENFAKGSCTFGEKCHFAHGASELRKSGV